MLSQAPEGCLCMWEQYLLFYGSLCRPQDVSAPKNVLRFDLSSDVWDVRRESLRSALMRKQSFLELGFCSRDSLGQASFQGGAEGLTHNKWDTWRSGTHLPVEMAPALSLCPLPLLTGVCPSRPRPHSAHRLSCPAPGASRPPLKVAEPSEGSPLQEAQGCTRVTSCSPLPCPDHPAASGPVEVALACAIFCR